MTPSKPRPKKCKVCKTEYLPVRPLQLVCGYDCSMAWARIKGAKASALVLKGQRKERKAALDKMKTLRDWIKDTQVWVNKWVRLRDAGQPCISCQRHHAGQLHAGHYRSTAAAPELRFNSEFNIHLQCQPCNTHLSGNILEYRINLIKKIGQDRVNWLEGKHIAKHYSIDDCKAIIADYKLRLKLGFP